MKTVDLSASKRDIINGKSSLNQLRKEGKVPAVLYGGDKNIHFSINEIAFEKLITTKEVYFINLDLDGSAKKAVIRDVQFHPVSDRPLHVDFMEISDDKVVTMGVPVRYTGASIGVLNGGKRSDKLRKLILKALPKDMPEEVVLDIAKLKIGQSIKVQDVKIPKVELLDNSNSVIVAVKTSRVAIVTEEEEAAAEEAAEGTAEAGESAEAGETAPATE